MNGAAIAIIAQTSALFLVGLVLLLAWAFERRAPYVLCWAWCFFLSALAWLLNLGYLTDKISDAAILMTATPLFLAGVPFALVGTRLRAGRNPRIGLAVLWFLGAFGTVFFFEYGWPHFGLRTGMVPSFLVPLMLWIAYEFYRTPGPRRVAEWGTITSCLLVALVEVIGAGLSFGLGQESREFLTTPGGLVFSLFIPGLSVSTGLFMILVVASDLSKDLRRLALSDPMTGVMNRRGFFDSAGAAIARADRQGHQITLVLADLDHFKRINDNYGHAAGDQAIITFADLCRETARRADLIGRLGGEEFAILLPDTGVKGACDYARRLQQRMADTPFWPAAPTLRIAASYGVAEWSRSDTALDHLITRADRALYAAKDSGRNRIEVAPPVPPLLRPEAHSA